MLRIIAGIYLGMAGVMDWKKRRVSVKLSLAFLGLGILLWLQAPAFDWKVLAGGILVGICMLGVGKITGEALGYGDGIAVAVTGCYLGFWQNIELLLTALALTAITGAVLLAVRRAGRKTQLPFLPFLFAAHVLLFCLEWGYGR